MYAGDEFLAADDDAFGPFAECEHPEAEELRVGWWRCIHCGAEFAE